ncbi:hypothetical protein ABG067_004474 [Albugo candida]
MTDLVLKNEDTDAIVSNSILPITTVEMHIVACPEVIDTEDMISFNPQFTYHLFNESENDETYEDVKIDVFYSALDLSAWLRIQSDSKCSDAKLCERLLKSLPPQSADDKENFVKSWDSCPTKESIGACIEQLSVDGEKFEIWEYITSENISFQRIFNNMQTMALWFIEGASIVDVTDPRWSVYVLYRRISKSSHSAPSDDLLPMGYITVFRFCNPFGRHCKRLVECVMQRARENEFVYEVTVEDPVPAFQQLRLLVDVEACVALNAFGFQRNCDTSNFGQSSRAPGMWHVPESVRTETMEAAQKTLKVTFLQTQMCFEVLRYASIDKTNHAEMRDFRIQVKRRLYAQFAEDVESMSDARRKAFLQERYQTQIELYAPIVARVYIK